MISKKIKSIYNSFILTILPTCAVLSKLKLALYEKHKRQFSANFEN